MSRWLLALLAAFALAPAIAGEMHEWLDRMEQAVERLNYKGTFVHLTNGRAETMRVIRRVDGDEVSERLVSLHGSGREIIRKNDETKCILQAEKTVLIDKRGGGNPLRSALPRYSQELADYYDFVDLGRERVADRFTRVIEIAPHDKYRYGYQLWLDEETAMPLQSVLVDEKGRTVDRVLFTEISFPEHIDDAELEQRISGEGYQSLVRDSASDDPQPKSLGWSAERLPEGFKPSMNSLRTVRGAGEHVVYADGKEHLVYSDGLASVSVFVEPLQGGRTPHEGVSSIGGANAFGTIVEGHQITVVGEVPVSTLRMIGGSIRRQPNP